MIGLVHGLAGSAASRSWFFPQSTIRCERVCICSSGAGTMLGMMVMTAAMAMPLNLAGERSATLSRYLGTVSGMASLCFGSFLIFQLGIMGGLFTSHPVWTPR